MDTICTDPLFDCPPIFCRYPALSDEKEVEGVTYQPCIVTFIDILGFRTLIENRPPKEVYKVLQSLKHFTNPVEDLFGGANISISRAHARSVSDAVVRRPPPPRCQQAFAVRTPVCCDL